MRIFAFHLLNDYSGSPKVLMQSINAWVKEGHEVTVVTCKGREGFLSDILGVSYNYFWYKLATNRFQRLIYLLWSQLLLIAKLLFVVRKEDVIYINTVLPFGAAFLGIIQRCRVIYHIHETSIKPLILKKFLFGMVKLASSDVIYVSNFLAEQEKFKNKNIVILHNAIENNFLKTASAHRKEFPDFQNVLMVCSLKTYKGVNEFVVLSRLHQQYQFRLVVNATQEDIDQFFTSTFLPNNIEIYPTQTNLHPFYSWADTVLNLSHPDAWIETFGLTVIEAMAYGLPVIVPPVGGITELVEEGGNGFMVDSRNIKDLSTKLKMILQNRNLYTQMRIRALQKIHSFREDVFAQKSLKILNNQEIEFTSRPNKLKLYSND